MRRAGGFKRSIDPGQAAFDAPHKNVAQIKEKPP
jgi:hypothetical protein